METSLLIARLIGPVLAIAGLVILLNPKAVREMAEEILASRALIFIVGFMTLLGGLAIVNTHNQWTGGWTVVITIFGWLTVIVGVIRMAFPTVIKPLGEAMLAKHNLLRFLGGLQFALGAFFVVKGYF